MLHFGKGEQFQRILRRACGEVVGFVRNRGSLDALARRLWRGDGDVRLGQLGAGEIRLLLGFGLSRLCSSRL